MNILIRWFMRIFHNAEYGDSIEQLRKDLDHEVEFTARLTEQVIKMSKKIDYLYEQRDA